MLKDVEALDRFRAQDLMDDSWSEKANNLGPSGCLHLSRVRVLSEVSYS